MKAAKHQYELISLKKLSICLVATREGPRAPKFEQPEIDKLLAMDVIEPAQMELSSPIVFEQRKMEYSTPIPCGATKA